MQQKNTLFGLKRQIEKEWKKWYLDLENGCAPCSTQSITISILAFDSKHLFVHSYFFPRIHLDLVILSFYFD